MTFSFICSPRDLRAFTHSLSHDAGVTGKKKLLIRESEMGKIVRMPCARVPEESKQRSPLKPTNFFSDSMGGLFMKWTYSTDVKGYRKVMIGGVQLDCEGCPQKVRLAIFRTDGVKLVRTDMENEIVYVMGKNMSISELKKNVRLESNSADILDILPWKIKY